MTSSAGRAIDHQPWRRIKSGGLQLAIYAWGDAPEQSSTLSPSVVLVHGYPDAAQIWCDTAGHLAENYRVFAYDVRGAGASSRPGRIADYALEHLVDDLAAVADAVSPDAPVHLLAHDWGSIQCWEAVCTERMRGRIASFTSISGPSLDHAGHWLRRHGKSGSPDERAKLRRQLARSWYVIAFHLPFLAPVAWRLGLGRRWPSFIERTEGLRPPASPTQAGDGAAGVNLYRANFVPRLLRPRPRRTEVPVQLLVPTRDRYVSRQIWDDLPQWVARLWRRDIDAGHWLPLSHPQWLAECTSELIEHIEGGTEPPALRAARVTPR